MSEEWDGKVFMSTPGGPVVTMSLGDVLARKDDEIERLRAEVERLRAALRWYADLSNHLPVECRDPGDPDPAVVVLDEPPILRDNGTLARAALEAKP